MEHRPSPVSQTSSSHTVSVSIPSIQSQANITGDAHSQWQGFGVSTCSVTPLAGGLDTQPTAASRMSLGRAVDQLNPFSNPHPLRPPMATEARFMSSYSAVMSGHFSGLHAFPLQASLYEQSDSMSVGSDTSASRGSRRAVRLRRQRRDYTGDQVAQLERIFTDTPYPDRAAREELAQSMDRTLSQINAWFSNRRAKQRKLHQLSQGSVAESSATARSFIQPQWFSAAGSMASYASTSRVSEELDVSSLPSDHSEAMPLPLMKGGSIPPMTFYMRTGDNRTVTGENSQDTQSLPLGQQYEPSSLSVEYFGQAEGENSSALMSGNSSGSDTPDEGNTQRSIAS